MPSQAQACCLVSATSPAAVSTVENRCDSPVSIYRRYQAALDAWYEKQSPAAPRTNTAFRKARNLLCFGKKEYN
ncbi:hypothetical protein E4U14_006908 [Claviceps sp. LM454 group G7]|nr:hypothetical protein E4U14_006908 [Claviceps sp. LM454 group G7]